MTRAESMVENAPVSAPAVAETEERRRAERHVGWYDRFKFEAVRLFLAAWAGVFSLKGLYLLGQWFGTAEYAINFKRRNRYRR